MAEARVRLSETNSRISARVVAAEAEAARIRREALKARREASEVRHETEAAAEATASRIRREAEVDRVRAENDFAMARCDADDALEELSSSAVDPEVLRQRLAGFVMSPEEEAPSSFIINTKIRATRRK